MGYDNTSITVDGTARTYKKAFDAKYASELAKGNTAICKCDITDGRSILRVSHEATSGQQRHLISLEDLTLDTSGSTIVKKVHVVISCPEGDPTAEESVEDLALGLIGWLDDAGIITGAIDGEL